MVQITSLLTVRSDRWTRSRSCRQRFEKQKWLNILRARTWPRSPDGYALALGGLAHLETVPGGGQDVGQEHVLLVRRVRRDLQQVHVSCARG